MAIQPFQWSLSEASERALCLFRGQHSHSQCAGSNIKDFLPRVFFSPLEGEVARHDTGNPLGWLRGGTSNCQSEEEYGAAGKPVSTDRGRHSHHGTEEDTHRANQQRPCWGQTASGREASNHDDGGRVAFEGSARVNDKTDFFEVEIYIFMNSGFEQCMECSRKSHSTLQFKDNWKCVQWLPFTSQITKVGS